jgi:hypothetical protein
MLFARLIPVWVAVALLAAAAACGGSAGGGAARTTDAPATTAVHVISTIIAATASPAAARTVTALPPAVDRVLSGRNLELTPDLNGLTVQVPAGEIFHINLGGDYSWSVDWSPPGVARSWTAVYQPRGSQGYYSIDVPGSAAVLSGSGTPNCGTPVAAATCSSGSPMSFRVMVVAGPAH